MSTKNTVPKLVAAEILRTLEDNLIANKICSSKWTGEIHGKGDSVVFPCLADPTIRDYEGSVSYEGLEDAGVTLNITEAKYFAFKVGDIEALQSSLDMKASQAQRAAYALKEAADRHVLGLYSEAGNVFGTGDITITEANVVSTLAGMAKKLRENNVTNENIFMIVPPFVEMFLRIANVKFQINNGTNGRGGLAFTNELGFDLFVSNQLTELTGAKFQVLAGSYNSIAYAEQIVDTETIRLESSFDDAIRGLHVYGAKVIKPKELVTASFVEGTPSGI